MEQRVPNQIPIGHHPPPRQPIKPDYKDGFIPKSIHKLFLPDIIQQDYNVDCKSAADVDEATRAIWYQRFVDKYTWNVSETAEVQRCFRLRCNKVISKGLCDLRAKGRVPNFLKSQRDRALELREFYLNDPEYQKKRERARKNAAGEGSGGHTRHRLGPHSIEYWIDTLTKQNGGVPISPTTLYRRIHMDRDGNFLNSAGEQEMAELDRLEVLWYMEHEGEQMSTAVLMKIWEKVLGKGQRSNLPKFFRADAVLVEDSQYYQPQTQAPVYTSQGSYDEVIALLAAQKQREDEREAASIRRVDDLERRLTQAITQRDQSQVYRPSPPPPMYQYQQADVVMPQSQNPVYMYPLQPAAWQLPQHQTLGSQSQTTSTATPVSGQSAGGIGDDVGRDMFTSLRDPRDPRPS